MHAKPLMPKKFVRHAEIENVAKGAPSIEKEGKVRRISNYTIKKESFEDMCKANRFNPCLEITFKDKTGIYTHKLDAGYGDTMDVYREAGVTYVLSRNSGLGYIGLQAFEGEEKSGDMFLESEQAEDILGRDDLAPYTIIRRLIDYIIP